MRFADVASSGDPVTRWAHGLLYLKSHVTAYAFINSFWKLFTDGQINENNHAISGVACRFNTDVASSGDPVTRWACEL